MKKLLLFLLIVILATVGVGGYLGLVPGLSSLFGAYKNRDLGVKWDEKTVSAMAAKSGIELETVKVEAEKINDRPVKYQPSYSGGKDLTVSLTSEELTAWARDRGWPFYPVSNAQVRVNADGTVEASGVVRVGRLASWITATGGDGSVIETVRKKVPVPLMDVPGYIKGTASVVDNRVSLNVQTIEVGRIPVPVNLVNTYKSQVEGFIEDRMRFVPNLDVKKLDFSGGKMNFEGKVPAKETIAVVK